MINPSTHVFELIIMYSLDCFIEEYQTDECGALKCFSGFQSVQIGPFQIRPAYPDFITLYRVEYTRSKCNVKEAMLLKVRCCGVRINWDETDLGQCSLFCRSATAVVYYAWCIVIFVWVKFGGFHANRCVFKKCDSTLSRDIESVMLAILMFRGKLILPSICCNEVWYFIKLLRLYNSSVHPGRQYESN
jgi:hypothetical protein